MNNILPKSVTRLIDELSKLPTVGPKTASRLTIYLLGQSESQAEDLGQALIELKKGVVNCQKCFTFASAPLCPVCQDLKRDGSKVLVVEEPLDTVALERSGFSGYYHVLGGVISPIDGVGPEDLKIAELFKRIIIEGDSKIKELIIATNPSLEGEATAMYIAREIGKLKKTSQVAESLSVTRLARGLPQGGDLEYADEETLSSALEGRRKMV